MKNFFSGVPADRGVEFVRYSVASGAGLAVDLAVLFVLVAFGVHYLLAAALGFLSGMSIVYAASVTWVFVRPEGGKGSFGFAVFVATGIVGLALNEGVIWASVAGLGLPLIVGKAAATIFSFSWNFFARKLILFR